MSKEWPEAAEKEHVRLGLSGPSPTVSTAARTRSRPSETPFRFLFETLGRVEGVTGTQEREGGWASCLMPGAILPAVLESHGSACSGKNTLGAGTSTFCTSGRYEEGPRPVFCGHAFRCGANQEWLEKDRGVTNITAPCKYCLESHSLRGNAQPHGSLHVHACACDVRLCLHPAEAALAAVLPGWGHDAVFCMSEGLLVCCC